MLQEGYLCVTKVFLGHQKVVTRVFQWSDMKKCHIRNDMSRVTSQELQVKSEKSRVTSQELQFNSQQWHVKSE